MKLAVFLTSLYLLLAFNLFYRQIYPDSYPVLRDRLGTILSHSSDLNGQSHLYCYYPGEKEYKLNQQGEQIIKRVEKISDCQGWYGVVEFHEAPWVSEIEKLWWSKAQKDLDTFGLAGENYPSKIDPL